MKNPIDRFIVVLLLCSTVFVSACHRSTPQATKRYPFTGRIISVNAQEQSANIDGDLVQGFMEAMVMTYKIKPPSMLRQLSPGDSISAEVVVLDHDPRDENAASDYWLENVKVTAHAAQPPATGPKAFHMPSPGEEVPDFAFTDQDGKHISLHQFRGKVLMVTFIYTRCPFPDFCPRMSGNFAEIYKKIGTDPQLANTQLLSVSFDPEYDTPEVLRQYGFLVAHTHDAALFRRWEFAALKTDDLPKIADFFALTVKPEGGMITHNLSTAVIGPDGKVVNWYHGGDWQVSDLIKDAASAHASKA
ncbi:MAG TPA: SCO family protein [Candidatus Sulfotelmatobacter sp.]|nr:SCO family protein [Candidatus Sulfotelmatobacter sp.]